MVDWIWRYPLKSAQGESLERVFIGPDGPDGDRAWACVTEDGMVVSAKSPRRWGRMLFVSAAFGDGGEDMFVRVPGGESLRAGTPEADAALSGWLGARVRLTREVPPQPRLHRLWPKEAGMLPEWAGGVTGEDGVAGEEVVSEIGGARPGGRFVDFGAVHFVTTGALDALERAGAALTGAALTGAARAEVAADARRMRPNLVLTLEREPVPGDRIQVGPEVTLRVLVPTPRCAVPAAAQPGLDEAPAVLREIGRHRTEIPGLGRAACFGSYAQVVAAGTVSVGDPAMIAV
jgi:uncharacterized protein